MIARVGLAVSLAAVVLASVMAGIEIRQLSEHEVNYGNEIRFDPVDGETELARVLLHGGTTARFELCASDPMLPRRWADTMQIELRLDGEVGLVVPLDERALGRVRRDDVSGCLSLGSGPVWADGEYAIVATYEAPPTDLAGVDLRARVVARRELSDVDLMLVVGVAASSFLVVLFLALGAKEQPVQPTRAADPGSWARRWLWESGFARVSIGLGLMWGAMVAAGSVARGPASGLLSGLMLAAVEVGLALALVGGGWAAAVRVQRTAIVRPARRWWLWFPAAGVAGVALMALSLQLNSWVPSTSTSSIQVFVSWPSGLLSFAALAVSAPLAEEVFFRGFVYGALKRHGVAIASAAAWITFVAFHYTQTSGQWGALAGIAATGLGLTALRALSGSALVAATAHLVYNGLLAVQAFV